MSAGAGSFVLSLSSGGQPANRHRTRETNSPPQRVVTVRETRKDTKSDSRVGLTRKQWGVWVRWEVVAVDDSPLAALTTVDVGHPQGVGAGVPLRCDPVSLIADRVGQVPAGPGGYHLELILHRIGDQEATWRNTGSSASQPDALRLSSSRSDSPSA